MSNSIRTEAHPHCLLCGTHGVPLYEHLRDRLFGAPGEWTLVRCGNASCGLVWLDPMPLEEDIGRAYDSYYTHANSQAGQSLASRLLFRLLGLEQERQRLEHYFLDDLPPGRLLEVGFGDGKRLERFKAIGWEVEGQEMDPVAIATRARKV